MKKCPFCLGEIDETARKCKHCGEWQNENESAVEPKERIQPNEYRAKKHHVRNFGGFVLVVLVFAYFGNWAYLKSIKKDFVNDVKAAKYKYMRADGDSLPESMKRYEHPISDGYYYWEGRNPNGCRSALWNDLYFWDPEIRETYGNAVQLACDFRDEFDAWNMEKTTKPTQSSPKKVARPRSYVGVWECNIWPIHGGPSSGWVLRMEIKSDGKIITYDKNKSSVKRELWIPNFSTTSQPQNFTVGHIFPLRSKHSKKFRGVYNSKKDTLKFDSYKFKRVR